jgi:hypothetical protein
LGCFGGREVVSLQGQGNEAGGLVEEIYSGACCAALDGSLFVLVLAHQDQLVWFDGERGRVIFSWSVGFESQNFGKYVILVLGTSATMPPKKPAARKRQQSHLEKDEQIHFKLHVSPKASEQLSNMFCRPL